MIISLLNSIIGTATSALLIGVGIYFSLRLRIPRLIVGAATPRRVDKKSGGVSPFSAVTVALAGTLGVGNIVGVAGAITSGGAGSIFWMWISAICAMSLKYAETVLAVAHRRRDRSGTFYGGAVYYIRDIFASLNGDRLGNTLATVFAMLFLADGFTTGCAVQINAAANVAESIVGIPALLVGVFAAVATFVIVAGGTKQVAGVSSVIIPTLSGVYLLLSAVVLIVNADRIPSAISSVFSDAFNIGSAASGIFGFISLRALRFGTIRGLLSNEAGCGSSPTAHAGADTGEPVRQGFLGIFEVFFDTIILCTATALVILVNRDAIGVAGSEGVMLAVRAYSVTLGKWSEYLLAVSVAVFGMATVVCRAHYGCECVRFLCRGKGLLPLRILFLAVFAAVTVIGAVSATDAVLEAADLAIGCMTLLNLAVLLVGRREIISLTESYFTVARTKKKVDKRPFN